MVIGAGFSEMETVRAIAAAQNVEGLVYISPESASEKVEALHRGVLQAEKEMRITREFKPAKYYPKQGSKYHK